MIEEERLSVVNMLKASKIKINDVYTDDYGIHPKERVEVPTPERDIEHVEIQGRHSSLTKKHGYKDIPLSVFFYMKDEENFKPIFRKAKMKLLNAKTIAFDDDKEVFYKVKSVQINGAENIIKTFGEFMVDFVLEPFQYEIADSTQTVTDRTIINNEGYESQPIIMAEVSGSGSIYVNDDEITIVDVNGSIIIDSELMNAYRNNNGIITNLNNHMVGDFPVLEHGNNVIEIDGDIERLEINPRWRWV